MKTLVLVLTLFILLSCGKLSYSKLVNIPEASGICYNETLNSFFVVDDEGSLFQVSKSGKILNKKNIGDYDFEGIVCDDKNNKLFLLVENNGSIIELSSSTFKLLNKYKINISKNDGKKYFNDEKGAEGLAYDGEYFYISTQSKKNNLLKLELKNNKLELKKIIDIDLDDLSGLTIYRNRLYILSDKNNLILKYDIENKKIIKTTFLEKGSWEGICFDDKGKIYLADDDGKIVKL